MKYFSTAQGVMPLDTLPWSIVTGFERERQIPYDTTSPPYKIQKLIPGFIREKSGFTRGQKIFMASD